MHQHETASGAGVAASVAEAASVASATASVANLDMDAPADFFHWEALRKTEMFQGLLRQVRKAVKKKHGAAVFEPSYNSVLSS